MSQPQYTTIYFKSPFNDTAQKRPGNRYLRKYKQQFSGLSDSFKTQLQETSNVFKVKDFKRQFLSFTEKQQAMRRMKKSSRYKMSQPENLDIEVRKENKLPKIEIKHDQDQDKIKTSKTTKSSKNSKNSNINAIKSRQCVLESQQQIKSARYSLAPHLNLQKTIYLFKKQSLDYQMNKYLSTRDRKEKSVQFLQECQKFLVNQKMTENQQLKGFKTTIYRKQVKKQPKVIKYEKKSKVSEQNPEMMVNKVSAQKKQDFTPWHVPQYSIIL